MATRRPLPRGALTSLALSPRYISSTSSSTDRVGHGFGGGAASPVGAGRGCRTVEPEMAAWAVGRMRSPRDENEHRRQSPPRRRRVLASARSAQHRGPTRPEPFDRAVAVHDQQVRPLPSQRRPDSDGVELRVGSRSSARCFAAAITAAAGGMLVDMGIPRPRETDSTSTLRGTRCYRTMNTVHRGSPSVSVPSCRRI